MSIKDIVLKIIFYIKKNFPLLISLLFWFLISFLLIIFINKLFQSNQEDIIEKERVFITLLIGFSLTLTIFITIFITKLFISIKKSEFGSRMRLKITLFFIFVAILPTIPFIQIGTKFISSSMDLWFSKNYGFALDLSEEIIKNYYNEKKYFLTTIVDELNSLIKFKNMSYNEFLDEIPNFIKKNKIDSMSIWTKNGKLVKEFNNNIFEFQYGMIEHNNKKINLSNNIENNFTVETKDKRLYLVMPSKIFDDDKNLLGFLNIAVKINSNFNKAINEIDDSLRNYNTSNLYKKFFTNGFIFLFLVIIFPIILIILIISLFLSKYSDPIENLSRLQRELLKVISIFKFTKHSTMSLQHFQIF